MPRTATTLTTTAPQNNMCIKSRTNKHSGRYKTSNRRHHHQHQHNVTEAFTCYETFVFSYTNSQILLKHQVIFFLTKWIKDNFWWWLLNISIDIEIDEMNLFYNFEFLFWKYMNLYLLHPDVIEFVVNECYWERTKTKLTRFVLLLV